MGAGDGRVRPERGRIHRAKGTGTRARGTSADSEDPANNSGASRIIHVDKNGKFKNHSLGNEVGQGKFNSAHGLAGRSFVLGTSRSATAEEDYRIVVYLGNSKFLKTMQIRNLVCALYLDSKGKPVDGRAARTGSS